MIVKTIGFVLLLTFGGMVCWYFLRDTPEKRIVRWRGDISRYLAEGSGDLLKSERLRRAQELNARVLALVPTSAYDLMTAATIREEKGTPEAYLEAIAIYDRLLARSDPRLLPVALLKSRLCRLLGRYEEAETLVQSVLDSVPFYALLELGELACGRRSPELAVRRFSLALRVATGDLERAMAHDMLAAAHQLMAGLGRGAAGGVRRPAPPGQPAPESPSASDPLSAAVAHLEEAWKLLRIQDSSAAEATIRIQWLAEIAEKTAVLRRSSGDGVGSPFSDALTRLQKELEHRPDLRLESTPDVRIRLASLRLRAALEDEALQPTGIAADLVSQAESDFSAALALAPDAARALLDDFASAAEAAGAAPEPERLPKYAALEAAASTYLGSLMHIGSRILSGRHFGRLIEDGSPVALARRIGDASECRLPEVARAFKILLGLAKAKGGNGAEAGDLLDASVALAPEEARAAARLETAGLLASVAPESDLTFRYLDAGSGVRESRMRKLQDRIAILLALRESPPLAPEAGRRLQAALREAREGFEDAPERGTVADILYAVEGPRAAVDFAQAASRGRPEDLELRRVLVRVLRRAAEDPKEPGGAETSASFRRKVLEEEIALYIADPLTGPLDLGTVRRDLGDLRARNETVDLHEVLKARFGGASDADIQSFSEALVGFLGADVDGALAALGKVAAPQPLEPLYSFLVGSCHLGIAERLAGRQPCLDRPGSPAAADRQAAEEQRRHLDLAADAFRRSQALPASQYEILGLELRALAPEVGPSQAIFDRIDRLPGDPAATAPKCLILASALRMRFETLSRAEAADSRTLRSVLAQEQYFLRRAVQLRPHDSDPYLALAENVLLLEVSRHGAKTPTREDATPADYSQAIDVLKWMPSPDTRVLRRICDYLVAADRPDETKPYLELLALSAPDERTASQLLATYLRTQDPGLRVLLPDIEAPVGSPPEVSPARREMHDAIRDRLSTVPEWEGLRYLFLALRLEQAMPTIPHGVSDHRLGEVCALYDKSLAAYESRRLPVPMALLNNLAWCLSNRDDETHRGRALEIADAARKQAPDARAAPSIADTYAWALFRNGRLGEARDQLVSLQEVADLPAVGYHLAQVLEAMGQSEEALEAVRRALSSPRSFPERGAARQLEIRLQEALRKAKDT